MRPDARSTDHLGLLSWGDEVEVNHKPSHWHEHRGRLVGESPGKPGWYYVEFEEGTTTLLTVAFKAEHLVLIGEGPGEARRDR
jgi:hypothetical protein